MLNGVNLETIGCGENAIEKGAGVLDAGGTASGNTVGENSELILAHPAANVCKGDWVVVW